jgi:hypothetical protein
MMTFREISQRIAAFVVPKIKLLLKLVAGFIILIIGLSIATLITLNSKCSAPAKSLGQQNSLAADQSPEITAAQNELKDYKRPEESTYLTYPEWYIVYSSQEYADYLGNNKPSGFPYYSSISQYWSGYCTIYSITKTEYEFNAGDHFMLFVIGWSYSAELAIKGAYENTIGRFTEWTSSAPSEEDRYAARVNQDYVDFIRDVPWYEYDYANDFKEVWTEVPLFGPQLIRKWERKLVLSLEFGIKTVYGAFIKAGTKSLYGTAVPDTYALTEFATPSALNDYSRVKKVRDVAGKQIIIIPRYQEFTNTVPQLIDEEIKFIDISGNDTIFLTAIAPVNWQYGIPEGRVLFEQTILTAPHTKRMAFSVPVTSLDEAINHLQLNDVFIEHIHDY